MAKKQYRVSGTQPLEIPRGSGMYREPEWTGEADPKDMEFYVQIGAAEEVKSVAKSASTKAKTAKRNQRLTKQQASPKAAHTTKGLADEQRKWGQ